MAKKKLRAHLVSQTHWDREWYLPFEEFRFHLVRLMDRVLHLFETQPDYKHFVADGQTIVLEDYLAIRPEREEEIRRHIQSGRLVIGPWHVLPDEYIVSGESLVRNLLMGRRVARRFGPISKAGYVPDPFGHVAQLPQILQGFGLDTFIFLRGMPPAEKWGTEFFWEAPDRKSTVLAIWMKNIYFNASLLGYEQGWGDCANFRDDFRMDRAIEQIGGQIEDLGKWTRRGVILLNNGCDHTPPQFEIPEVLRHANKHFKDTELVHSTYDKFVADVKRATGSLRTMRNVELRSSRYIVVLPGVLSARMPLKQWNRECEALLERWTEPTTAIVRHLGGEDHSGTITEAWRLMLENHPHDSICGCSTDAVHREMTTRYEKIEQIGRTLRDFNLRWLESHIDTQRDGALGAIVSWNPLPARRRSSLHATVTLPNDLPTDFRIVDEDGTEVPFQAREREPLSQTAYLDFNRSLRQLEITLDATQSGLGYRTFFLMKPDQPRRKSDEWSRAATKQQIETDFYRITFNSNGSINVVEKSTGREHRNLMLFEDSEDVGDEYDYSHAKKSQRLTTEKTRARVRIADRGPLHVDYAVVIPWKIPAAAAADRKSRLAKTVDATLELLVRIHRKSPRIDVTVKFDNRAKDHRLRVLFDAPRNTEESIADGHFAIVRRPIDVVTTPKHDGLEPTTHHMRHWVAVSDGGHGLAVLNRRLTEYELIKKPRGRRVLAITLLRSVGWLSKDDLLTRPSFAGPMVETPEAQCLGPHETEFALLPFRDSRLVRDVVPEAESWAAPVLMRFNQCQVGNWPASKTWLDLDRDDLVFSAWKPAEEGPQSVIRFYNPDSRRKTASLTLDDALHFDAECDLKEESIRSKLKSRNNTVTFESTGCRITSLLIS